MTDSILAMNFLISELKDRVENVVATPHDLDKEGDNQDLVNICCSVHGSLN